MAGGAGRRVAIPPEKVRGDDAAATENGAVVLSEVTSGAMPKPNLELEPESEMEFEAPAASAAAAAATAARVCLGGRRAKTGAGASDHDWRTEQQQRNRAHKQATSQQRS
jgi:hypothetical protein